MKKRKRENDEHNDSSNLGPKPGLCLAYIRTGVCPRQQCKFSHPEERALARLREEQKEVDRQRRGETEEQKRERQLGTEDKGQRAKVFCDWIIDTWGEAALNTGLILDIAGGRGDLAFELATRRGLHCAVVDPRPAKLKKWQVKYQKKNPQANIAKYYQDYFNSSFLSSHSIPPSSVQLVVGLHPDEATEPLVAEALSLGLDFCVIPCCVFSSSFPDRRLKDGSSPSSYEQFCEYLKEKDDGIQEVDLQFGGKNKVLFRKNGAQGLNIT
jgi:hypothetical protein